MITVSYDISIDWPAYSRLKLSRQGWILLVSFTGRIHHNRHWRTHFLWLQGLVPLPPEPSAPPSFLKPYLGHITESEQPPVRLVDYPTEADAPVRSQARYLRGKLLIKYLDVTSPFGSARSPLGEPLPSGGRRLYRYSLSLVLASLERSPRFLI